jgi:hypothetical protein
MSERTMDSIDKGASHPIVRRVLIGALYGFLTGTAFVLMSAFIDILLHPDLPLGVDWSLTAGRWAWIGLGLTLIGSNLLIQRNVGWFAGRCHHCSFARIDQLVTFLFQRCRNQIDGADVYVSAHCDNVSAHLMDLTPFRRSAWACLTIRQARHTPCRVDVDLGRIGRGERILHEDVTEWVGGDALHAWVVAERCG